MFSDYFEASRGEIPVLLVPGPTSAVGPGYAVWVSSVYGYSTGVTIDLKVLISPELAADVGVPYPEFSNDIPEDVGPGTVRVTVETPTKTHLSSDGSLIWVENRSSDRLAEATCWVPGHPTAVTVTVDWPATDIAVSLSLPTEGWRKLASAVTKLR